jgi:hypothetical protein
MMLFNRTLNEEELQSEKLKDYRRVVSLQIIIVVFGMIMSALFDPGKKDFPGLLTNLLFSGFGVIYSFLLWDLLRNFTQNQYLIVSIFFTLVLIVLVGLVVENPFVKIIAPDLRRPFLLGIHGALFPIEILVIGFTIVDVFRGNFLSSERLWGAACIFLMIGISFASLYDLISIIHPGSLGVIIPLGLESYSECIYYSFNVLGGLDTAYPEPIKLIRNLGVIEAVWGNLFTVLIIGKLLTLPSRKEN